MVDQVELKPCPFCGGEARGRLYVRDGGKAQCTNPDCYASVTQFNPDGAEKAIAAWNTRTAYNPNERLLRAQAALGVANGQLRQLADKAEAVMTMLDAHGAIIVPHLLDTDDNAGQFLREAIESARAVLTSPSGLRE